MQFSRLCQLGKNVILHCLRASGWITVEDKHIKECVPFLRGWTDSTDFFSILRTTIPDPVNLELSPIRLTVAHRHFDTPQHHRMNTQRTESADLGTVNEHSLVRVIAVDVNGGANAWGRMLGWLLLDGKWKVTDHDWQYVDMEDRTQGYETDD